jgi:hypothetical protein
VQRFPIRCSNSREWLPLSDRVFKGIKYRMVKPKRKQSGRNRGFRVLQRCIDGDVNSQVGYGESLVMKLEELREEEDWVDALSRNG